MGFGRISGLKYHSKKADYYSEMKFIGEKFV